MTARLTLWTFEDQGLAAVTDAVNVKLAAIADEGSEIWALFPISTVSTFDGEINKDRLWHVAQIVYQAGEAVTP